MKLTGNLHRFVAVTLPKAAQLSLLAMTLLITVDVVMRYLFRSPLIFADEIATYLLVLLVFLGLGYVESDHAHVSVRHLKPESRIKKYVSVAEVLYLVFMLVGSVVIVLDMYQTGTVGLSNIDMPLYLPATLMVIGLAAFLYELVLNTYRLFRKSGNSTSDDSKEPRA